MLSGFFHSWIQKVRVFLAAFDNPLIHSLHQGTALGQDLRQTHCYSRIYSSRPQRLQDFFEKIWALDQEDVLWSWDESGKY
jgi:hypothetical protein